MRNLLGLIALASTATLAFGVPHGSSQDRERKETEDRLIARSPIAILAPLSPQETTAIAKQLNLTPHQQRRLQDITHRYARDIEPLKDDYGAAVRGLLGVVQGPPMDRLEVGQRVKAFTSTFRLIMSKEAEYWIALKALLTPEQNDQLGGVVERRLVTQEAR